jgi:hypothetical protein
MCKEHEWWPRVESGVMDVAGKQHHAHESQQEIWRAKAFIHLRAQFVPIESGIERYDTILIDPATDKPRIHIDPKCRGYIGEHRLYKYMESRDGSFSHKPVDRHNHAIKAVVYGLVDRFGFSDRDHSSFTSVRRKHTIGEGTQVVSNVEQTAVRNAARGY